MSKNLRRTYHIPSGKLSKSKPVNRLMALVALAVYATGFSAMAAGGAPDGLTARGKELEEKYNKTLSDLRAELCKSLPTMDEEKKAAFQKAREVETAAKLDLEAARKSLGEVGKFQGLVNHAKGKWIGGAEKGIAKAQADLKQAASDAERKAAQDELAKWQADLKAGREALKEREAALAKAKQDEARSMKLSEAAEAALTQAQAGLMKLATELNRGGLLDSDRLDGMLAKCVVLSQATPTGLARFAQQGEEQGALVEQLLADESLMERMLTAGGAKEGKYGEAMKIYTDILKTSEHARQPGVLQNLALGISLELVQPYRQRYRTYLTAGMRPVDPVQRFLHYEKAFLAGELDPAFKGMTAWECRWIASDPSSDEDLAWLRTMMRNYRPDLVPHSDPNWYYTRIIKTDVGFGGRRPWDDSLQTSRLQQAIDRGGICHIRAWIARSTARAFGIPARRVEQGGAESPVAPAKP